jgi:CRISPR system Cascade subunit CasB
MRAETAPAAIRQPRRRPRTPLGEHVADVIADLQWRYQNDRPDAAAALARLRRAVTDEPGTARLPAACWLPDELIEDDYRHLDTLTEPQPTPAEQALHSAVTLWALHQQSRRDQRMHSLGTPFAAAVQRLALASPNEETVHARFAAAATAATYRSLTHHARGLILQLRDAQISFDYGLFADDLVLFQRSAQASTGLTGPERVRSRWGREYWRARPASKPTDTTATDPSLEQE